MSWELLDVRLTQEDPSLGLGRLGLGNLVIRVLYVTCYVKKEKKISLKFNPPLFLSSYMYVFFLIVVSAMGLITD